MNVEGEMRARLQTLRPEALEIVDDSAQHVGHPGAMGGGGHYSLTIVSKAFVGKPPVARHRMVYAALGDLIPARVHAIVIRAYAPGQL